MRGEQFYRGLLRIMNDIFAGYEFLATVNDKRRDLTRFASSQIHQNVSTEDTTLNVLVLKGKKLMALSSSDISTEALKKLRKIVDESIEALPDLPYDFKMPPLRMALPYEKADPSMKDVPPSKRAEVFDLIKSKADERNLKAYGYIANDHEEVVVMSTSGLFLYATYSAVDYNVVLMNDQGGSSYASGAAPTFEELDIEEKIEQTAELALKNVPQAEIEPGEYRVILGPEAVAELFSYFAFAALNGFSYEIGTSSAVKYLGRKVAPEFLTFKDDPADGRLVGIEFDAVGTARSTLDIIEKGELKRVLYGYGTALRFGKEPTGHTVNLENLDQTFTLNPVITGGDVPKDRLFEMLDKGIYIHRLHYVNVVDPSELVLTGMTRDGFFLVEGGKVTKALRNMRFNVNFYEMLKGIEAMSQEEEIVNAFVPTVAPYILTKFTFTSKTDH